MATFEDKLAIAIEFNKKLIAGDKVGRIATESLIRADGISDEDLKDLVYLYPKWKPDLAVEAGDLYRYNDKLYEVIQDHTTQADWTPDITPSLWTLKMPEGVIGEFVQPTGGHDAYNIGDRVMFEGLMYESLIDANTWSPTSYPQGWKEE